MSRLSDGPGAGADDIPPVLNYSENTSLKVKDINFEICPTLTVHTYRGEKLDRSTNLFPKD